jgi:hypothetical protein
MKKVLIISLLALTLIGCQQKEDSLTQLTPAERDSLVTDIITFIYIPPLEATTETRFDLKYRKYYASKIQEFRLEKFFINKDGVHFYYVIRPARSAEGNIRGVGGYFKKDATGKIISFKEVFNTPVRTLPELQARGDEMFQALIRDGNVDGYLKNSDYVEWPNKYLQYDTIQYKWVLSTDSSLK